MLEASLSCYTRRDWQTPVLALEGTLDMATAPQAADALQRFCAEHGPNMILDMSRLDFIDSKGVGVLLSAAKLARDGKGQVFLHNPTLPVRKILETCGLMSLFPAPPDLIPMAQETSSLPEKRSAVPRPAARPARRAA